MLVLVLMLMLEVLCGIGAEDRGTRRCWAWAAGGAQQVAELAHLVLKELHDANSVSRESSSSSISNSLPRRGGARAVQCSAVQYVCTCARAQERDRERATDKVRSG